ncbi:MAG: glycosyltransferase family A protein, partial [Pseudomonadota bacterium]|nr:glycosyltransferase family A protein [Pseudomonadota bacterium]
MSQQSVNFWTQLDTLLYLNAAGDQSALQKLFDQLLAELEASDPAVSSNRRAILEELSVSLDLTTSVSRVAEAEADAAKQPKMQDIEPVHGVMLDALDPAAADGISLVTCCMNRNGNLLKALRTWLPCKEINEIIIVDWSSDTPVSEELKLAGIQDPRVRVLRIDGEPRWILTYAFNVGFRLSRYSKILKVDADIELSRSFFRRNRLKSGEFIAGNWRNAEKGQEHVNGFFYCHRTDLAKAGGFNEYITTYGWDDDDLYGRLELNGTRRKDVDVRCIRHLDHS